MDTRKNLRKPILGRIYFIDAQIAAGRYPNVHFLASEYSVGTATIYRDIEYMKYSLNAPIEYCAKKRGWYYSEKTFRLPGCFAAADDMLALGMAKSLISLYRNTPLFDSAKRLLNDITSPLAPDPQNAEQAAWYEKRIIVPSIASVPVDPASRMKNVLITDECFELPDDFDYCSNNDSSYFGVFSGEKNILRSRLTSGQQ